MYKRASRAMLHAHRVESIDPARGFIAPHSSPDDAIMAIGAMPDAELNAERDRLRVENRRWLVEQQAARAANDARRVAGIGSTLQTIQGRASAVNDEIKRRNIERNDREIVELKRLLRAEVGDERFMELVEQARSLASAVECGRRG